MADIKLTKNELRAQQGRLRQLEKYLPTLQLKKAMLQGEVNEARLEIAVQQKELERQQQRVEGYAALLSDKSMLEPSLVAKVEVINKYYDNIAGVEVPKFESVRFFEPAYNLFETPPWTDAAIEGIRDWVICQIKISIAEEKCQALEKEFREVSIRVNLFEKILIPRALGNIKKIKVFLGDQQLAAVAQAKVAKRKITCA
jgi:V/A-type H+/Na+-transporting ATPase subunit D